MTAKFKRAKSVLLCNLFMIWCFALLFGISAKAENNLLIDAGQKDSSGITVKWTADDPAASYEIYRLINRSSDQIGDFELVNSITAVTGEQEYTDNNVSKGNTYYYRIRKMLGTQAVNESETVGVKMLLQVPQDFNITADKNNCLNLTWKKVKGAKSYIIYRKNVSSNSKSKYKKLATVKKRTYKDSTAKAGYVYSYKLIACDGNDDNNSPYSEEEYGFIKVSDIEVTGSFKSKKIKLSWSEVPAASSYVVYKKNSSGKYVKLSETTKTSYTDSKIKKGKQYKYKVEYVVKIPDNTTVKKKSDVYSMYASEIDPTKKMVALTFDDGPGRYTQEIVDCLKANDAKATFFVLGCNVSSYKSAVKNAHDIGCEIGNHSYDHKILSRLSSDQIKKEMSDTDAKVKSVIGSNTTIMRCPGGGVNSTVQAAVGKPIVHWSIDTLDWKTRSTEKTISAVMNNVKDGDIVLMHDIHAPTKRAALSIIPQLKKKGYQLVTVSELAQYRGYKLQKGTVYRSLRKKK